MPKIQPTNQPTNRKNFINSVTDKYVRPNSKNKSLLFETKDTRILSGTLDNKTDFIRWYLITNSTTLKLSNQKYEFAAVKNKYTSYIWKTTKFNILPHKYIFINMYITGSLAKWVECSSMVLETSVQSQARQTKDFKNGTWYLLG